MLRLDRESQPESESPERALAFRLSRVGYHQLEPRHRQGLRNFYIPEDRWAEPHEVTEIFTTRPGRNIFAPGHVRDLVHSDFLNLFGNAVTANFVRRTNPVGYEILQPWYVGPTKPPFLASAGYAEMDGRIAHIRGLPPGLDKVPFSFARRILVRPHGLVRSPIHTPEKHLEPDALQTLTRNNGCSVQDRTISHMVQYYWPPVIS